MELVPQWLSCDDWVDEKSQAVGNAKIWGKLQGTMHPELSRIHGSRAVMKRDRLVIGIMYLDIFSPPIFKVHFS
jgi:hypothetical protein